MISLFGSKRKNNPERSLPRRGNKNQLEKSLAVTEAKLMMQEKLMKPGEIGPWLVGSSTNSLELFGNTRITNFLNYNFDSRGIKRRFELYNRQVENDKDRIRIHGQYYNNIYLGKRIFGPARKQVFNYTIVGGMERRFEIVDNQVNHIQFTHEMSDKFIEKCRNPRVKCRDDTRVVLRYPQGTTDTFIHANYVKSPFLFNDFIITQSPMENTIGDFWRMIWQERVCYIFMLISRKDKNRSACYWPRSHSDTPIQFSGLKIWNEGVEPMYRDPLFKITRLRISGPDGTELLVEHWQADMNNSDNVESPLRLLRLARSCTAPTVVHDYLGVSRAACLVAAEICICQLLRGPMYKYPVQQAVHHLRLFRPFSVETPMQYIFVHRVVQHFIRPIAGVPQGFDKDYARWLDERSQRLFVDSFNIEIPAFRLLSPKVDPDLLPLVRQRPRPELRREMHAYVGELPLPVEADANLDSASNIRPSSLNPLAGIQLPKRFPRGKRY